MVKLILICLDDSITDNEIIHEKSNNSFSAPSTKYSINKNITLKKINRNFNKHILQEENLIILESPTKKNKDPILSELYDNSTYAELKSDSGEDMKINCFNNQMLIYSNCMDFFQQNLMNKNENKNSEKKNNDYLISFGNEMNLDNPKNNKNDYNNYASFGNFTPEIEFNSNNSSNCNSINNFIGSKQNLRIGDEPSKNNERNEKDSNNHNDLLLKKNELKKKIIFQLKDENSSKLIFIK